MSISGMYFLTTKSGNVVRNSLVPMKPWLNLGQKLVFVSGDIFLDHPLPKAVTHLHDGENFDIRLEMENVSSDGVEKYRVNFVVVSAPDRTQDLADALEHFLLGSHDLLWERASMDENKRYFISSMETAYEVRQKALIKEAKEELRKHGPLGVLFSGFLDKLGNEDPTRSPFGLGERHESTGDSFLDMILGLGGRDRRSMDDEDYDMGYDSEDEDAEDSEDDEDASESSDTDQSDDPSSFADAIVDGELDHPEETSTEDGATDHSENTAPDGDAGEPSGLSSSEQGTH